MAIVPDLSGNFPQSLPLGVEGSFSTPNRKNAGNPLTVLTPRYSGEIVQDTTTGTIYIAVGLTAADWVIGGIQT